MTKLSFLNHSSLLVETGESSLLMDPWLQGSAFSGGWELEWFNPEAMRTSKLASHIWISHPHSDHLHFETLKALTADNPNITFLGSDNSMIDMNRIVGKLSFKNQVSIRDRNTYRLDSRSEMMTIPSMAIDYALAYFNDDVFILNVNDAIIDAATVRSILDKNPQLRNRRPDIICINFSHAHKIFKEDFAGLRSHYIARIRNFLKVFDPQILAPIASFHLYSGELAKWQNDCRLELSELLQLDHRICKTTPGSWIDCTGGHLKLHPREVDKNENICRSYPPSIPVADLKSTVAEFARKLKSEFYFSFLLPAALRIQFRDLNENFEIDLRTGQLSAIAKDESVDMHCYSSALQAAMVKPFGFDAFYVAADFEVENRPEARGKVRKFLFYGCLVDYSLTPKNVLRSLFRIERWLFIWNRREQFMHLLRKGYAMGGVS